MSVLTYCSEAVGLIVAKPFVVPFGAIPGHNLTIQNYCMYMRRQRKRRCITNVNIIIIIIMTGM